MQAIRYEDATSGEGLFKVLSGYLEEWRHHYTYKVFNTKLTGTDGYGPCWFTPAGEHRFRKWINRQVAYLRAQGIDVVRRCEDLPLWHPVDSDQLIECLGDDCETCIDGGKNGICTYGMVNVCGSGNLHSV